MSLSRLGLAFLRTQHGFVRRGLAAAAAAQPAATGTSEDLILTLASPDKAFFTKTAVKQVDAPTLAGNVGVLAKHVPTIGVLKPGIVTITALDGTQTRLFVSSGTLSMNIDGSLQVLAEEAIKVEDIDEAAARRELDAANQRASSASSDTARAEAQIEAEVADALIKAVQGQQ